MASFNQTRLPLLTIAISIVLMLATSRVNSASPSFCRECAPFIPGAVAYWPMTMETKGFDISGYENHAKLVGLTFTDGPTKKDNGAVRFNGSSKSFAKANNSPSMNVGTYAGFTFSGYVRYLGLQNTTASLIDWSGMKGYGVFIVAASDQIMQLHLFPNQIQVANRHKAEFLKHKLINGAWHFIGMSYDKSSGRATMFNDGQLEVKQLDKNIAAGSDKTSEVGLGIDLSAVTEFNYKGDMSCMMLFKFALTVDDFKKVWEFCRKPRSTQTIPPNITVSDKNSTNAIASWTKSPGIFSGYNVTIERKDDELSREATHPKFIRSSATILKSALVNLVPGTTYRVHVWHMQGELTGRRARSSAWFATTPYLVVESDSIIISELMATSARVSWKDVNGDFDGYSVEISPTTGGAKAGPSTVPRGMTTTSLKNLAPMTYYTISIRAKIGLIMNSPSTKLFRTPEPSLVVESNSIIFSEITATSANVSWEEVSGKFDSYIVDISPTTGGAKAVPSIVGRGTTTTSLQNLSPGRSYFITIRTKIGSRKSLPSMNSFHTLDADTPNVAVIGWIVAGIICFVSIVVIVLKVYWKKIHPPPSSKTKDHEDSQQVNMPMLEGTNKQTKDHEDSQQVNMPMLEGTNKRMNNLNIRFSTEDDHDQTTRGLMDEDRDKHKKVTNKERCRNEIGNVEHGEGAMKKNHAVNGNGRWEQLTKQFDVLFPKIHECKQLFRIKQRVADHRLASLARSGSVSWADTIYFHNEKSSPLSVTIVDGVYPAIDMAVLSTGELLVTRREKPYIRAFSIDTGEWRDINIEKNEKTKDGMWRVETDESDNMFLINSANDPFLLVVSPNGKLMHHVQLKGRVLHMAFSLEKRILYVAAGDKVLRFQWLKNVLRELTPPHTLEGFLFRDICIGVSNDVLVVGEMAGDIAIYQVIESKDECGLRKITYQDDMERQKIVPHICIMENKLWLGNVDKMEMFELSR